MKIPTSRATTPKIRGSVQPGERSGASACTATIVPTPRSSAAAARNARLRRSSVRSEGFGAMIAGGIGRKKERRGSPAALLASGQRPYAHFGSPSLLAGASWVEPTYTAHVLVVGVWDTRAVKPSAVTVIVGPTTPLVV